MNPARALGPIIVSGSFDAWWAYVVGPIVGGILGAAVYDRVLAKAEQPSAADEHRES